MKLKRYTIAFLMLLTGCGGQNLAPTVLLSAENNVIHSSSKKMNINERKENIELNGLVAKEKISVKDLPANFMFLPLARQATDYTCGAAALQSVLQYYGDEYMEGELAKKLKSDPNEGTSYHNISDFSKANGYKVNIYKDMTLEALKKLIDNKKPVLVLLQAWSDNPVDYSKDWDDGHYSVVIGYDSKHIYLMDPSTMGNYTFIPTAQFVDRWHDVDIKEKLNHFGMVVEKKSIRYNHNDILLEG